MAKYGATQMTNGKDAPLTLPLLEALGYLYENNLTIVKFWTEIPKDGGHPQTHISVKPRPPVPEETEDENIVKETTPMAANQTWYWLNTTYACGGIATNENGIIVDACPIYRRGMIGKSLARCLAYLKGKRTFVELARLQHA